MAYVFADGDFSLTTNNTAVSTTRLFPKQWKVTGNGVSTSTLNCIVTDRAVNGLPDSVSGNAMRLTCKQCNDRDTRISFL